MLLPGSKGWIRKFFALHEEGDILLSIKDRAKLSSPEQTIRNIGALTGLTYGHCIRTLYPKSFEIVRWTDLEVQKVALFECLLEVYRLENPFSLDIDAFIHKVSDFYGSDAIRSSSFLGLSLNKQTQDVFLQVENILNQRLVFNEQRFDFKWWKYAMSNTLVYLDVLLFHEYLKGNNGAIELLQDFERGALYSLVYASQKDNQISNTVKTIINLYLASSRLGEEEKNEILDLLHDDEVNVNFADFGNYSFNIKAFYIDLMTLLFFSTNHEDEVKNCILMDVAKQLQLPADIVESAESFMQFYLIDSEMKSDIFSNKNSYEKVFNSFSNRWSKILLRNKDKIVKELVESKELISLVSKSTTQELTSEEKIKVKQQFRDIVKTVPALGIFMLPGGAILLPLILKIIPDLIPSAFRDNEIKKD